MMIYKFTLLVQIPVMCHTCNKLCKTRNQWMFMTLHSHQSTLITGTDNRSLKTHTKAMEINKWLGNQWLGIFFNELILKLCFVLFLKVNLKPCIWKKMQIISIKLISIKFYTIHLLKELGLLPILIVKNVRNQDQPT